MSGENIFICYAKQDRIYVDAIATEASKYKGLNLFAAHITPPPDGEDFRKFITKKIEESVGAILLISNNFLNSDFINGTELPLIFKQKEINKNYKLSIALVEDCDYESNKYLKNKQFSRTRNSTLSKIKDESSLFTIAIKDILSKFVPNVNYSEFQKISHKNKEITSAYKRLRVSFFVAAFLAIFFSIGTWSTGKFVETFNIEVDKADVPVTTVPVTTVPVISSLVCIQDNYDLWTYQHNNFEQKFPSYESYDLLETECSQLHSGEIYHTLERNYLDPSSFSFEQRNNQALEVDSECVVEFKNFYNFTQSEGPFKVRNLWFLDNSNEKVIIACIGVKPNINKGGWQEWEGLISNFQINRYKENIQYEENVTLSEYKPGDCGLFPDWFYNYDDVDYQRAVELPWARVDCYSPHDFEVMDKYIYSNLSDISREEHEELLIESCYAIENLYSSLDELFESQDEYGTNHTVLVWGNTKKLGEEPVEIFCLSSWSEIAHYQVDFSLENSFKLKKYNLNYESTNGEAELKINNCPDEVPATFASSNFYADTYWFDVSWSNVKNPLKSIYVEATDPYYFFKQEINNLENYSRYKDLYNWKVRIPAIYEVLDSYKYGEDQGTFKIDLVYGENKKLTAECIFNLFIQEE